MNKSYIKAPEPYSQEWNRLADLLARSFAPHIYPCAECRYPVASGYTCGSCGNNNPRQPRQEV